MSAPSDKADGLSTEARVMVDTYWRDRAREAERELVRCREGCGLVAVPDVVEALRRMPSTWAHRGGQGAADFIEREFGGKP